MHASVHSVRTLCSPAKTNSGNPSTFFVQGGLIARNAILRISNTASTGDLIDETYDQPTVDTVRRKPWQEASFHTRMPTKICTQSGNLEEADNQLAGNSSPGTATLRLRNLIE